MSNYLPVLLVSVSTNAVTDDSSLTTAARAQVDYLSHDWQEEDVWRSWRNMTRQKNEIANGIRLENASWRTWWKQRNKLKTISPETLNWLKDSDVTWLYGPLHTAVDWAPPPKPQALPNSVNAAPASAQDRLDLSIPTTKPILKHRSISELLTSDLPSPLFSPTDSGNEDNSSNNEPLFSPTLLLPSHDANAHPTTSLKRPPLLHTKSDTHITRWGNRAFRKDSPPRVDPPNLRHNNNTDNGYFSRRTTKKHSAPSQVRISLSQDSTSSTSATSGSGSGERSTKKKHISFNTFVEQCIAIEKPKVGSDSDGNTWSGQDDDDGYEEDEEDNSDDDDGIWNATDGRYLSGSAVYDSEESPFEDDDEKDVEDEGGIQIHTSSTSYHQPNHTKRKKPPRSQSTVSSSSSASTSTTTSSSSINDPSTPKSSSSTSSCRKRRQSSSSSTGLSSRRFSTSTYRPSHRAPPSLRTLTLPDHRHHITIAPIEPTMLKTTGAWEESLGDESGGMLSDDGFGFGLWGTDFGTGQGYHYGYAPVKEGRDQREKSGSGEGTPVELVYVPPFGSPYSNAGDMDVADYSPQEKVFRHPGATLSTSVSTPMVTKSAPIPIASSYSQSSNAITTPTSMTVPTVVVDRDTTERQQPVQDESPDTFFDDSEFVEEEWYRSHGRETERERRGRSAGAIRSQTEALPKGTGNPHSTSQSNTQSRSFSRSRTPSPLFGSGSSTSSPNTTLSTTTPPVPVPVATTHRGRSTSFSPSPSSQRNQLLSPPQRGRSSFQDLSSCAQSQGQTSHRGRSSTRTPSSSFSDRERGSADSPMGSLSPDGVTGVAVGGGLGVVGGAYANGRGDVKDRDKDRDRDKGKDSTRGRGRGRDKGKRALGGSSSPLEEGKVDKGRERDREKDRDAEHDNRNTLSDSVSSVSSSGTVVPTSVPSSTKDDLRDAEEVLRRIHPTPSNSPVVAMRMPRGLVNGDSSTTPKSPTLSSPGTSLSKHTRTPSLVSTPPRISPSPASPVPAAPSTSYVISMPSPTSPKAQAEGTIVEKAVGMVSSAGAYFGLWQNGGG